ncbi:MAG: type II toxin-antitoxin system VapB family antitoxin [Gemmatimonadetes bacterium]|nr:type II toxin-antitoxin system VapB family antitoxin [Gemmatimonadota bacterium]MYI07174.1 type II toxin-antitoxin system VapB family antitoxin [Gemmatimonadota bacterium]
MTVRVLESDVEAVRRRYGLRNWDAAVRDAVCRQAVVPMTKEEALAMRGVGWDGDLDEMRAGSPGDVW